ncbi:unnamed protein product, partial [Didymodactylos carnosus]
MKLEQEKRLYKKLQELEVEKNQNSTRNVSLRLSNLTNRGTQSKVVNLSSTVLNKDEECLLGLGLSYIPTSKVDSTKYVAKSIAGVESGIYKYAPVIKEKIVTSVRNTIDNHLKQLFAQHRKNKNLTKEQYLAIKNLKDDDYIIVVPADKGGKLVVMEVNDYIEKIE